MCRILSYLWSIHDGSRVRRLMFGFMLTTAFLSMWISNTATTAMMIPIAHAVLKELSDHRAKVKIKVKTDATAKIDQHGTQYISISIRAF